MAESRNREKELWVSVAEIGALAKRDLQREGEIYRYETCVERWRAEGEREKGGEECGWNAEERRTTVRFVSRIRDRPHKPPS
jgi:hypothetical protein